MLRSDLRVIRGSEPGRAARDQRWIFHSLHLGARFRINQRQHLVRIWPVARIELLQRVHQNVQIALACPGVLPQRKNAHLYRPHRRKIRPGRYDKVGTCRPRKVVDVLSVKR